MAEDDDELPPEPGPLSATDPRIREAEGAREDFLSLTVVFMVGAIVLLSFAVWRSYETEAPRSEDPVRVSTLPRTAGTARLPREPVARPVPPARSPTLSPSPMLPLSEYVDAVRADDVCRVAEKTNSDSIGLLMAMPEFRELSLDAQALVRAASGASTEEILDGFQASGTDWAQFYQALLLGGLLEGASGEVDLPRAEQILQRLAGAYPQNGVFAYYLIPVLEKLNSEPGDLDQWIVRFAEATTFDDGSGSVYREIRAALSENASGNMLALGAVAQLPSPSPVDSTRVITARLQERPELAPAVHEASQRFRIEEASRSGGIEFFDWSAMEIATFTNLGSRAWSTFSTEPYPAATAGPFVFQNFRDLLEAQENADPDLQAYYSGIEGLYAGQTCDPDAIRAAFERVRSR